MIYHKAQGMADQIEIGGIVNVNDKRVVLMARVPPNEAKLAREILYKLFLVDQSGWDLEIRDQTVTFWSALHNTFAYRMKLHECGKGLCNVTRKARGLIERIKAGHYAN